MTLSSYESSVYHAHSTTLVFVVPPPIGFHTAHLRPWSYQLNLISARATAFVPPERSYWFGDSPTAVGTLQNLSVPVRWSSRGGLT